MRDAEREAEKSSIVVAVVVPMNLPLRSRNNGSLKALCQTLKINY